MNMKFEWDFRKAIINIEKHGVTFEEASTVFDDEFAILFDDPDHSENEDRYIILGLSAYANVILVCHA